MLIKQVILIRKDLKMRRGKEIAQGSHASMEFLVNSIRTDSKQDLRIIKQLTVNEMKWLKFGMAKVCLKVESESELVELHEKALELRLKSYMICDSGKTEFHGQPTLTACAIGPDDVEKIDQVTGHLKTY